MIFPIGVDYRTSRYPMVTFTIMGLCTLLFIPAWLGAMTHVGQFPDWHWRLMLFPSSPGVFGWVTSLFIHGGFFHLLGNMAYLFLFGSPAEDTLGRKGFVAFYLVAGVAAGFLQIALSTEGFRSEIPICGASGAISACMGATVLLMPKARVQLGYFFLLFVRPVYGSFELPGWLVIGFWFLQDVLGWMGSLHRPGGGVAFGAHVGGFLFGMLWVAVAKIVHGGRFPGQEDGAEGPEPEPGPRPVGSQATLETETGGEIQLWDNGVQTGPYSRAEVKRMLESGSLDAATCLHWRPGLEEWRPVGELE